MSDQTLSKKLESSPSPQKSKRIYFPGLNALRFFAATIIIMHHCEQYKYWDGIPNLWGNDNLISTFIDLIGVKAVSLFFVLSGFLITYLMLAEIDKTQTVDLKKFWLRRILRIWPVYYFVLIVSFFVIPHISSLGNMNEVLQENFITSLGIYLIILPNLIRLTAVQVVGNNQAWSVGVEEQFYFIWPILVRMFHKWMLPFLFIFTALKMLIGAGALIGKEELAGSVAVALDKFYTFWDLFRIEQMAIGALGATYLYKNKETILRLIYSPITQVLAFGGAFLLIFTHLNFYGSTLIDGLIFLIIIMNVSCNEKCPVKLKSKRFDVLGNISYGIYMYHTICITLVITLLKKIGIPTDGTLFNVLLYSLSIALTLTLAYLSYEYFEKFFLKFKDKFAIVKSSASNSK